VPGFPLYCRPFPTVPSQYLKLRRLTNGLPSSFPEHYNPVQILLGPWKAHAEVPAQSAKDVHAGASATRSNHGFGLPRDCGPLRPTLAPCTRFFVHQSPAVCSHAACHIDVASRRLPLVVIDGQRTGYKARASDERPTIPRKSKSVVRPSGACSGVDILRRLRWNLGMAFHGPRRICTGL